MYLNRLQELREESGKYQQEVADYLGIKQSNYSRYETGEVMLPIDRLEKLAIFYNTSTDYILNITDVKKPYPRKGINK